MNALLRFLPLAAVLAAGPLSAAGFEVVETDARIEIRDGDRVAFGWQRAPIAEPKGGEKFAASAFVHPLATPSGFGLTNIQPSDHLHHFGVWWPWKYLEVGGKKYNCWELQAGEGRHAATGAEVVRKSAAEVVIRATNRHEIKDGDAYRPVLDEEAILNFRRLDEATYQLDIAITQTPVDGVEVLVSAYRYSGFSWRGPAAWNGENSRMQTSGGHNRTNANHQPANWTMVGGPTPAGKGTMLILSAAPMDGGEAELLRVWGPDQHHGEPFVNFNPVVKKSPPLSEPAVAHRKYRLIMTDREIAPAEADKLWEAWKTELAPPSRKP
jgi:hypothetical protein